jgi:hypothetical protein
LKASLILLPGGGAADGGGDHPVATAPGTSSGSCAVMSYANRKRARGLGDLTAGLATTAMIGLLSAIDVQVTAILPPVGAVRTRR